MIYSNFISSINQSNSRPKEFLGTSICSAVHVHTVEAGHFPSQSYNMHASCVTGAWKVIWRWSKSCRGRRVLMFVVNVDYFWCWQQTPDLLTFDVEKWMSIDTGLESPFRELRKTTFLFKSWAGGPCSFPAARINRPLLGKDTVYVRDFHGVSAVVFVDKLGMLSWWFSSYSMPHGCPFQFPLLPQQVAFFDLIVFKGSSSVFNPGSLEVLIANVAPLEGSWEDDFPMLFWSPFVKKHLEGPAPTQSCSPVQPLGGWKVILPNGGAVTSP